MSLEVRSLENGEFEVVLAEEPGHVRALRFAPDEIEPELRIGRWLVVTFSVWSGTQRKAVATALACAGEFGAAVQLGLRPLSQNEEIRRWSPRSEGVPDADFVVTQTEANGLSTLALTEPSPNGPFWLGLCDGVTSIWETGVQSKERVLDMLQQLATERDP